MAIDNFGAGDQDYISRLNLLVAAVNAATAEMAAINAGGAFVGTSSTSNTVTTGSKSFTVVETNRAWGVGAVLRVVDSAAPGTNYLIGTVTGYAGTSLTLNVTSVAGSGTHSAWIIGLEGVTSGDALRLGKHAIWLPAAAWTPRTTNGADIGSMETTTNKVMVPTLDFDAATIQYAQTMIQMPPSWDHGTLTGVPVWRHGATTTNFGTVWGLQGQAVSNDDALDAAWGSAQTSTDTGGTTDDFYRGPETAAITLAGSPAQNDMVLLQCYRDPTHGSDTLAVDAGLLGWLLFYTINAGTDA